MVFTGELTCFLRGGSLSGTTSDSSTKGTVASATEPPGRDRKPVLRAQKGRGGCRSCPCRLGQADASPSVYQEAQRFRQTQAGSCGEWFAATVGPTARLGEASRWQPYVYRNGPLFGRTPATAGGRASMVPSRTSKSQARDPCPRHTTPAGFQLPAPGPAKVCEAQTIKWKYPLKHRTMACCRGRGVKSNCYLCAFRGHVGSCQTRRKDHKLKRLGTNQTMQLLEAQSRDVGFPQGRGILWPWPQG